MRLSPETCRVKPLRRIKTQLLHLVGLISLLLSTNLKLVQKGVLYSGSRIYNHLPLNIKIHSSEAKCFKFTLRVTLLNICSVVWMNIINQHPNDYVYFIYFSLLNYNLNNSKILFNVKVNLFIFFISFLLILCIYIDLLSVLSPKPCTLLCIIVTDSISVKI